MTKLIIIRAYPGSGKTTVGKQLAAAGVGAFIDHNAILTFITNIVGDDDGIYDDIVDLELALTHKLLASETSVIVARGFGNPKNIEPYQKLAANFGIKPIIIRLAVSQANLHERVVSKERLDDFNPTITKEALDVWVQNNPMTDHPNEVVIDNNGDLKDSINAILDAIQ